MVGTSRRRALPAGVQLYRISSHGQVELAGRDGTRDLGGLLPFIDDGQFAHYLIGDAATSPDRPSNATVKLGLMRPHSAFTPHAHRGEHFVLSLGHAACGLYDETADRVRRIPLAPGELIRIPAMMPHSFANRGAGPLVILAANTGYGIDHEDYAVTAPEAEHRAAAGRTGVLATGQATDYRTLAAALRAIEAAAPARDALTVRERLAARLRRLAHTLEARP
ncbi:cupin domain-containing protein [Streptomyces sp. NPDC051940]|uniref:cupin domain-containing protein n=1 Tax=Streptomyces sp. NPDC051940 TaxID=3155675 RepID=UPI0034303A8C